MDGEYGFGSVCRVKSLCVFEVNVPDTCAFVCERRGVCDSVKPE